jgi:hypothetical protein
VGGLANEHAREQLIPNCDQHNSSMYSIVSTVRYTQYIHCVSSTSIIPIDPSLALHMHISIRRYHAGCTARTDVELFRHLFVCLINLRWGEATEPPRPLFGMDPLAVTLSVPLRASLSHAHVRCPHQRRRLTPRRCSVRICVL